MTIAERIGRVAFNREVEGRVNEFVAACRHLMVNEKATRFHLPKESGRRIARLIL